MNIIIIGVQGSGKGTESELLSEEYEIPTLSVGQLLRDSAEEEDPDGLEAKKYWIKGDLAPSELVIKITEKELTKPIYSNGVILDGFPRELVEAKALDEFMDIDKVILLQISDELAVKRIAGRTQCSKCDDIYGIDFKPKQEGTCDKCGGKLERREDDTPEKVKHRIELYHKETEPVLEHYKKKGILEEVDASKSANEVLEEIKSKLGE